MTDLEGLKAIRTAIKAGDTATVLSLISERPERLHMTTPFGTWLHIACSSGKLEIAKALLAHGAEINQRSGVFDAAPIKEAASDGHVAIVAFLLNQGAELDVSDPERNPLFAAIYGGNIEIVKLLLKAGIDHTVRYTGKSMKDMDAKAFAIERGQHVIAELFEKWGK